MERGFIVYLVLSGLGLLASSVHRRSYHFIDKPKTWTEAQQYCREKHTDLATISDEEDLEELAGLTEADVSYVFLGLYRSWGWSLSDDDDYKEGEPAYWNWAGGEPKDNISCGSIGATGRWFATNCSNSLNFSCYDGSQSDLSERFSLGSSLEDWFTAQDRCRDRHTDLTRVRNRLENEELQRMASDDQVWIGLTRSSWEWSDGSEPSFIPWRPLEPLMNGLHDCGVLEVNSKHLGVVDSGCADKLCFFCYSETRRKRLMRLKLIADDSSVDLTGPAVMESILKQVENGLSDVGATKDVKLNWRKLPEKEGNTEQDEKETAEKVCNP